MEQTTESPLDRAIRLHGGITKLARDLGLNSHAVINGWRKTRVPSDHCPSIEGLTGVPCEELRPDVRWEVLRAKAQPTQAGQVA
ncbi:transcriptional regulator [Curvibacter lanceolatus]|uniref:transcriptional regulator n=1 Tax=Curvibacter lanceolatus TaxID=86182 RepID=UPI000364D3C1|nr:YdaS family helix-turn-helix protein [Curvibacter lanceolatus]